MVPGHPGSPAPEQDDYARLVLRVRSRVRALVPADANVLVVSRGDEALVDIADREAGHFPQSPAGLYAGHYPGDGEEAVAHLEALRAAGAEYLVIPATGLWWLEHYGELSQWLEAESTELEHRAGTGAIFRLHRDGPPGRREQRTAPQVSALLKALLPPRTGVALIGMDADAVDLEGRPRWLISPPAVDTGATVESVLAYLHNAAASGADYGALLVPELRPAAPDATLRQELRRRFKTVCVQQLVELFSLVADGPDA